MIVVSDHCNGGRRPPCWGLWACAHAPGRPAAALPMAAAARPPCRSLVRLHSIRNNICPWRPPPCRPAALPPCRPAGGFGLADLCPACSRRDAPCRADAAGPPHALATFTRSAIRTRMPNLSSLRFMYLNIETKSASARAPGRSPRIFDLTNRKTFAYAA